MEQDVAARASDFLSDHFGERLTDKDRLSLEHWLASHVEAERKGWKSTLQRSLQEVERERKLGLKVHGAIQGVNERLEERMAELLISTAPSVYQGSDPDSRVYTIGLLDKNVDSLLRCIIVLLDEREKCFSCLAGGDSNRGLHIALSDRLIEMHNNIDAAEKKHSGEITELNDEMGVLRVKLSDAEDVVKERDELHMKEIETLGEMIARQSAQIDALNHWNKEEAATQTGSGGTNREICIQVDLDLESDPSDCNSMLDGKLSIPTPIRSVTISRSVDTLDGKRQWKTHTQDFGHNSNLILPLKNSDYFQETKSDTSKGRSSARSLDASDFDRRQTIDTLRGQVIEFAERLERAKDEVERYQRQLAWMKTIPHNMLINNELNNMKNSKKANNKYQDGFLSGTRKDLLPVVSRNPDVIMLKTHLRKRLAGRHGTSNNTSRCLRCHKLYKLRDNHRKACKYHPRGKKKIEKYDGNEKLVTVTFLWECCLQATDAQGCSSGEHI